MVADAQEIYLEAIKNYRSFRDTFYVDGVVQWNQLGNALKNKT